MSLPATCPDCGYRFTVDDEMEGRRVRCRHCQCPFVVRAPGRRAEERDPYDRDEPVEEPPGPRKGIPPVVWVLCGVGVLLMVLIAGCAGLFYYTTHRVGAAVDQFVDDAKHNMPVLPPPGGDPFIPFFVPVPRNLDEAIQQLQGADRGQRQAAAQWVQLQPVDAGRRTEVARALEPLLDDLDPAVRLAGMRALEVWGGAENVPAVVRLLESDPGGFEGEECRRRATDTLVRLKDSRGAAAVARQWKYPLEGERTRRALEKLGPAAEPAVLPYLNNTDRNVQAEACKTLQAIGTRRSLPDLQALLDRVQGRPGFNAVSASAREAIDAIKVRR
jgi:hypothetical protein